MLLSTLVLSIFGLSFGPFIVAGKHACMGGWMHACMHVWLCGCTLLRMGGLLGMLGHREHTPTWKSKMIVSNVRLEWRNEARP
jgi:hypothetical protein